MKDRSKENTKEGSGYKYGSDFIAYFLASPVTKEPEYEIRIKSDMVTISEYKNLLGQEKVEYRQLGLPVFPPPVCLILERNSVASALKSLQIWYNKNKDKNPEVTVTRPNGNILTIRSENDFIELLKTLNKPLSSR